MKQFFTQTDCDVDYLVNRETMKQAISVEKANKLLEQRGKLVRGDSESGWCEENHWDEWDYTHQALLINIQPLQEPDTADKLLKDILNEFDPSFCTEKFFKIRERAKKLLGEK